MSQATPVHRPSPHRLSATMLTGPKKPAEASSVPGCRCQIHVCGPTGGSHVALFVLGQKAQVCNQNPNKGGVALHRRGTEQAPVQRLITTTARWCRTRISHMKSMSHITLSTSYLRSADAALCRYVASRWATTPGVGPGTPSPPRVGLSSVHIVAFPLPWLRLPMDLKRPQKLACDVHIGQHVTNTSNVCSLMPLSSVIDATRSWGRVGMVADCARAADVTNSMRISSIRTKRGYIRRYVPAQF
jgi:hypothetical protein